MTETGRHVHEWYEPGQAGMPEIVCFGCGSTDYLDGLGQAAERALGLVESGFGKVIRANPRWEEIGDLLTEDELRVFLIFVTWASRQAVKA